MKKLVLLAVFSVLFLSCGNLFNKAERGNGNPRIPIKGTISASPLPKNMKMLADSSLTLSDARKVLIFSGNNYTMAEIVNGSFSGSGEMGTATALVFLNADNKYIGHLCAGGLNMLPLEKLKDGESTVIDLSTLSLSGDSVLPAHNPIGDEINIADNEIAFCRELGSFYESLAKNIDADNDGVLDILNKKQLKISSAFSIYGGHWGLDNTPPSQFDTAQLFMNYQVRIEGHISMAPANGDNVALAGPAGSEYTDISRGHYVAEMDCFIAFFMRGAQAPAGSPLGSAFLPFMKRTVKKGPRMRFWGPCA